MELANRGGVVLRVSPHLTAFVPHSQIDALRLAGRPAEAALAALVGSPMTARVLEVDPARGAVVASERGALAAAELAGVRVGDARAAVVTRVTDYGAFCELLGGADGETATGVGGLVHVSELAWSRVRHPSAVVSPGQRVTLQVLSIDAARSRLGLSLRRLAADPLLESLEGLLAAGGALPAAPMPELEQLLAALGALDGVAGVALGRQAREVRAASPDLEVWLQAPAAPAPAASAPASAPAGGAARCTLIARAGQLVQEVHVATTLDRDQLKRAVLQLVAAGRCALPGQEDEEGADSLYP